MELFCIIFSFFNIYLTPQIYLHHPQCMATIVILCIGETHNLINYVSFINYLSYGVTIAGLLYLRKKRPNLVRPIKVQKPENPRSTAGTKLTWGVL